MVKNEACKCRLLDSVLWVAGIVQTLLSQRTQLLGNYGDKDEVIFLSHSLLICSCAVCVCTCLREFIIPCAMVKTCVF